MRLKCHAMKNNEALREWQELADPPSARVSTLGKVAYCTSGTGLGFVGLDIVEFSILPLFESVLGYLPSPQLRLSIGVGTTMLGSSSP